MKILGSVLIVIMLSGCTSTMYSKTAGTGETTRVDHFSIGWDREGVNIAVDKETGKLKARINVDKSNGSNSTTALISAITETISKFE